MFTIDKESWNKTVHKPPLKRERKRKKERERGKSHYYISGAQVDRGQDKDTRGQHQSRTAPPVVIPTAAHNLLD